MRPIDMPEWDTYMKCMLVGRNAWDAYDRGYTDALDQADDWMDAQPTLALDDLRPHGRWVPLSADGYADGFPVWDEWECSECHHEHFGDEDTLTDYCPNCGAKMNLKEWQGNENT